LRDAASDSFGRSPRGAELKADHVTELEALVANADSRLYAAKQNGRNQVGSDDSLLRG
jgi:GGDEF domain-containing protein